MTIVVLTARDLVHGAMLRHIERRSVREYPYGMAFDIGELPESAGRVAIAGVSPANTNVVSLAERAFVALQPRALLFVGMAGSVRADVGLGDLVVAKKIYQPGADTLWPTGTRARSLASPAADMLERDARQVADAGLWTRRLPADDQGAMIIHFRPITTGEVVLNSRAAPLATQVRFPPAPDVAAIEPAAASPTAFGDIIARLPTLTIRGICDRADGVTYGAGPGGWPLRAADRAAAFAVALADQIAGH